MTISLSRIHKATERLLVFTTARYVVGTAAQRDDLIIWLILQSIETGRLDEATLEAQLGPVWPLIQDIFRAVSKAVEATQSTPPELFK